MKRGWILVFCAFIASAGPCLASKCDNPTGFMKQLCDSQTTPLMGLHTGALTAGVGQGAPLDVLPGTIDARGFEPLSKLERNNSGAFVLSAGIYEMDAEAFTLDSGNPASLMSAGFWPAPIQGGRAGVIGDVLKNTELHPELSHSDIQELIDGLMAGAQLRDMSAQAQQAAVVLLSQPEVTQLGGLPKEQGGGKHTWQWIIEQAAKNKRVQDLQSKGAGLGLPDVLHPGAGESKTAPKPVVPKPPAFQSSSIARGSWVRMTDGFFLRYLLEPTGRLKVQIAVPSALTQHPAFDPSQYIAVSAGMRLGVTLRAAQ